MTFLGRFVVILALVFVGTRSFAVPAYPEGVWIQLPNGEMIKIHLRGDEKQKWAVSKDNYTLLPTQEGWVYAQEDGDGYAVPSSFDLSSDRHADKHFDDFVKALKPAIPLRPNNVPVLMGDSHLQANRQSSQPMTGSRRALVILMEFRDCAFQKTKDDFDALFNEVGYNEDGAIGSVYDYFSWASHGQLQFYSDILGPFKTEHPMRYYGGNSITSSDSNPYALFLEAINHASTLVDLSEYDSNEDGYVDNIHIIFSGYGEEAGASSSAIWSHEMMFEPIKVQEMIIDRYSCAPELRGNRGHGISRIGPHCHEMGHALGAMDYYDTDYEKDGAFEGTGVWDIMAQGSWNNEGISPANFNPYVRIYNFGWETAQKLPNNDYSILEPSNKSKGHIYRVNTTVDGEFYLLENRSRTFFDVSLPGEGLHIYHIGAGIEKKSKNNKINAAYPQECYLVCASSKYKNPTADAASYGKMNEAGATFPGTTGNNVFNSESTPAALCQNGVESGVSLSEIALLDDGNISLFNGTLPEPEAWWKENFEDMASFKTWTVEDGLAGKYSFYDSNEPEGGILKPFFQLPNPLEGGNYFYVSNRDASSCKGCIISDWIPNNPFRSFNLSFAYHITSRTIMQKNGLTLFYRVEGSSQWTQLFAATDATDEWVKQVVELPQTVKRYQLAFEFDVKSLSAICLDDIKVYPYDKPMGSNIESAGNHPAESDVTVRQMRGWLFCKSHVKKNRLKIYDWSGRECFNAELEYMEEIPIRLPVGGYIIETKSTTKKIFVR